MAQCYLSKHGLPGSPQHQPDQATGQPEIIETGKRAMRGQMEGERKKRWVGGGAYDRRIHGGKKAGE